PGPAATPSPTRPTRAGLSHMADSIDEVVVVPGAFSDAVADGDFVGIGGLEDVSDDAIEERGVGGSVVLAGTVEVLVEMDVEHPVQAVLDLPVRPGELECLLRREHGGGHEQARQRLALIAPAGDADK